MRVEREFISDVTCMVRYLEQPLEVVDGNAYLPDNLYRLLAVYDDNDSPYRFNSNGAYLFDLRKDNGEAYDEDNDVVKIDYVGFVLDDECRPMIPEKHTQACEVFCKLQMFEEEYAMGKFSPRLYEMWQQQLPGLIQAARGSNYRQFTQKDLTNLSVVRGNMNMRLEKTSIRDENVNTKRVEE